MKTRILHTEFWIDEQVMEMPPLTKFLFIYFITNPHIELCPIYRIADRVISFETGLTVAQIQQAKKGLEELGKIKCFKDYIYITNADRYNRFHLSKTTGVAYRREWDKIPLVIKEALLSIRPDTLSTNDDRVSMKFDTPINKKQEIRNKKEGGIRGKQPIDRYIENFNFLFSKNYQVTDGRGHKLKYRLRFYSLEQILQATKNLSESEFHKGKNDRGWVADPDFLIRNDETVDKWLNTTKEDRHSSQETIKIPENIQKINEYVPTAEEKIRAENARETLRQKLHPLTKRF